MRVLVRMKASQIANWLEQLANLRNLERGVHGHSIGYRRAADAIAELGNKNITSVNQLAGIKYVGPKTLARVNELLETGQIEQVSANRALLETRHKSTSPAALARAKAEERRKSSEHPYAGLSPRRRKAWYENLNLV